MPRAPSVKEGAERVVTTVWLRIVHKHTMRTDAMLKAEELPAGISSLHTSLAHMNGDALSLDEKKYKWKLRCFSQRENTYGGTSSEHVQF